MRRFTSTLPVMGTERDKKPADASFTIECMDGVSFEAWIPCLGVR
jgi:hypothetical protein